MAIRKLLLLFLNVPLVVMLKFEKPVAKTVWTQRCSKNDVALNDCNWCHCNMWSTYTCKARACSEVDMLGHFKDTIKEMDLGMEGHGAWRSTDGACEAGVQYLKDDLLCVCDEDGKWPNPVCRDAFRILHSVVNTTQKEIANNSCTPTKLYLFDCNVCFCPSSGEIDPKLCTTENCEDKDTENIERTDTREIVEEVYAKCVPHKLYKLGCQTCTCLRNNRLLCDNCTVPLPSFNWVTEPKTECYLKKPGVTFKRDCNFCHCDSSETIYCTAKKCLKNVSAISLPKVDYDLVELVEDELNCVPQTKYKKDGNTCYCFMFEGAKYFGCSLKKCKGSSASLNDTTCVAGTTYQVNCLICHCIVEDGIKSEYCTVDESCVSKEGKEMPPKLSSMHGYCEPMHLYQNDCNKCRCLADGKTVACTSRICPKRKDKGTGKQLSSGMLKSELAFKSELTFKSEQILAQKPLIVEFVPFVQRGTVCPKGQKYNMVGCNICYCLETGNAICTTKRC